MTEMVLCDSIKCIKIPRPLLLLIDLIKINFDSHPYSREPKTEIVLCDSIKNINNTATTISAFRLD